MKEKVGAVLATATVLSGCLPQTAYSVEPSPVYPEIKLDALPSELPLAVAEQIPNVISVMDSMPLLNQTDFCSGVRIDKNDYLSAGHCDYQLASDALPVCSNMVVGSQSAGKTNGVMMPVLRKSGTYTGSASGYMDAPINALPDDLLLVETDTETQEYTHPTHFDNTSAVAPGTPLFLVNYEPTANDDYRSPLRSILSPEALQVGLDKPAILGGIALAQFPSGTIAAIADLKSYSSPPETKVRPGSSGGPVYDAEGNLVGTVVAMVNYTSLNKVENDFGIDINGQPIEPELNIFLIQDITPTVISELQSRQQPVTSC